MNYVKKNWLRKGVLILLLLSFITLCGFIYLKADFNGNWSIDESQSKMDEQSAMISAWTFTITHSQKEMSIERAMTDYQGTPYKIIDRIVMDGTETTSQGGMMGTGKRTAKLTVSEDQNMYTMEFKNSLSIDGNSYQFDEKEVWTLSPDGSKIIINASVRSEMGDVSATKVYVKSN